MVEGGCTTILDDRGIYPSLQGVGVDPEGRCGSSPRRLAVGLLEAGRHASGRNSPGGRHVTTVVESEALRSGAPSYPLTGPGPPGVGPPPGPGRAPAATPRGASCR